jgi:hypothetical protein
MGMKSRAMKPVEIVLRIRGGRMKEKDGKD